MQVEEEVRVQVQDGAFVPTTDAGGAARQDLATLDEDDDSV